MDRFPANGKLLKIYGRFLEYVRNDPWNASRCVGHTALFCNRGFGCVGAWLPGTGADQRVAGAVRNDPWNFQACGASRFVADSPTCTVL